MGFSQLKAMRRAVGQPMDVESFVRTYAQFCAHVRTTWYVRTHRFVRTYVSASWFQKQAEGQVPEAIINNLGLSPWRRAHPS